MKGKMKLLFVFFSANCLAVLFLPNAFAQSGGSYQITQSVVSTGEKSAGGSYSIEDTGGQPLAGGLLQASSYSVYSGFWTPPNLAPTATTVNVGGRVTNASGQGIRNVVISLTDSSGTVSVARTGSFGYYSFDAVRVGETYILTVRSRRFTFSNPTRVLSVQESLADVDFIAANSDLFSNF